MPDSDSNPVRRMARAASHLQRRDPAWAAKVIAAALTPETHLLALVGVPASGKSTVASLLAKQFGILLISSDAIRRELGDEADQALTSRAFERLGRALDAGATVIWDATNYQAPRRKRLAAAARRPGVESLAVHLRVPLPDALRRNEPRSRTVRPEVIELMHGELEGVSIDELKREGFTRARQLDLHY